LSDNYLKQSQINTVVVQQKDMDRVGFEPTTSASFSLTIFFYLEGHNYKTKSVVKSHPLHSSSI
jgi:hypothetical protein